MLLYADNETDINIAKSLLEFVAPKATSAASDADDDCKISLTSDITLLPTNGLFLRLENGCLSLTDGKLSMAGDFCSMQKRLKHNNLSGEMLVKSARLKSHTGMPTLIDATAGMGEDSLLLAAAGYKVYLYEYDIIIALLLKNTLDRAKSDDMLAPIISRMELKYENSIIAFKHLDFTPDVILLDPMFPERQKSGLIKKKFQLLQQLESPCGNENELLEAAIRVKPHKIIIKRPLKGPYLANRKPDYSLTGKAIRYDCIVFA